FQRWCLPHRHETRHTLSNARESVCCDRRAARKRRTERTKVLGGRPTNPAAHRGSAAEKSNPCEHRRADSNCSRCDPPLHCPPCRQTSTACRGCCASSRPV